MAEPTVRDIMVQEVISVHPDTSVTEAHAIIATHNFDGVPVVDESGYLVGIITEYDLIVKGSSLHLPTFQKILTELPVYRKDRGAFRKEVEELEKLRVRDVMNDDPLTLPEDAPFESVIAAFRDHHRVNPIPVIDTNHKVVGVVSRYDVLKLFSLIKPPAALSEEN